MSEAKRAADGKGRHYLLIALLVILALLLAFGALWWSRRPVPVHYVTATVARGNIQRGVATTGALNPVVTVQVGTNVSGTIKALSCDYNTEVHVGQVCATIDPVPFQLVVDQDRADVETAEAQRKKDETALEYTKIELDRDSKLSGDGTVSEDTIDADRNAYGQAVAQLGVDRATIAQKRAALRVAEVNLGWTRIASPVVGTVITRAIDVGQTVAASLSTPTLFLIAKDLTQMQVDTNVSEADVGELRVGQDALFTVQAFPGRSFHGKVSQIRRGPITVQNVVTYDVVVAVPNPDRSLFPGMTADTRIVIDEHDDVLRVPLPAVRFTPEGVGRERGSARGAGSRPGSSEEGSKRGKDGAERRSRVWVLRDGALRAVPVTLGLDDGANVEVSGEGLLPGDTVVVNISSPAEHRRNEAAPGQAAMLRGGGTRL